MNLEIANRLVELRKANGLSQEKLAEKLGVSRQAVSKWERGEASPDTDNLLALAEVYGTTLDALVNPTNTAISAQNAASDAAQEEAPAEKQEKTPLQQTAAMLLKFPFPIVVALFYLLLGFIFRCWHPAWLVFFLIPIYYHLSAALLIRKRKARLLAMPVPEVILFVYLLFGFLGNLWSPTWILFLVIPLYYWSVACFVDSKKEK